VDITSYRTISESSLGEYREKGSKFFAHAIPVKSEEEIKEHIALLRKKNPQAVHVCSAFRLGYKKLNYRSTDDGEPSNSAGPPILGQIQSFDLTNVLIAIVRYYGGTNLGVGGLINAYRTAAKDALENATIIEQEVKRNINIHFKYEDLPTVMKIVKSNSLEVIHQNFELECEMNLAIQLNDDLSINKLTEIDSIELIENGITE
jgi:uncharacterized YigZ family protein